MDVARGRRPVVGDQKLVADVGAREGARRPGLGHHQVGPVDDRGADAGRIVGRGRVCLVPARGGGVGYHRPVSDGDIDVVGDRDCLRGTQRQGADQAVDGGPGVASGAGTGIDAESDVAHPGRRAIDEMDIGGGQGSVVGDQEVIADVGVGIGARRPRLGHREVGPVDDGGADAGRVVVGVGVEGVGVGARGVGYHRPVGNRRADVVRDADRLRSARR